MPVREIKPPKKKKKKEEKIYILWPMTKFTIDDITKVKAEIYSSSTYPNLHSNTELSQYSTFPILNFGNTQLL